MSAIRLKEYRPRSKPILQSRRANVNPRAVQVLTELWRANSAPGNKRVQVFLKIRVAVPIAVAVPIGAIASVEVVI